MIEFVNLWMARLRRVLVLAGLPQAAARWMIGKLLLWHWRRTLWMPENESRVAKIRNYLIWQALPRRGDDTSETPILSGDPGWIDLYDGKPPLVRQR